MQDADDTPSKDAAKRTRHCNFMRQGGGRPIAAAGSRRTGRDKPWQPRQGYDQKETLQATPSTRDQIQNTP